MPGEVRVPDPAPAPTAEEGMAEAASVLREARACTDLARMERLHGIADSWLAYVELADAASSIEL